MVALFLSLVFVQDVMLLMSLSMPIMDRLDSFFARFARRLSYTRLISSLLFLSVLTVDILWIIRKADFILISISALMIPVLITYPILKSFLRVCPLLRDSNSNLDTFIVSLLWISLKWIFMLFPVWPLLLTLERTILILWVLFLLIM